MDQDRQIRFVIPPFCLLASLAWGAYLQGTDLLSVFTPETGKEAFGLLAAAAVAVVPIGFLIGSLSIALLRFAARVLGTPTYEAVMNEVTLTRIWSALGTDLTSPQRALTLYAAATYDHEVLDGGVHAWLFRRWTTFNVAAHSCLAIILAHVAAPAIHVHQSWRWAFSSAGVCALLVLTAYTAWHEVMKM